MEYITKSAEETFEIGRELSASLRSGDILALVGELGSGKTTFVQGLASGFGIDRVVSPTFILMREYEADIGFVEKFYHADLYRLEGDIEREMESLGIFDLWKEEEGVFAIEWADKAPEVFPGKTIWIDFEATAEKAHKIVIRK